MTDEKQHAATCCNCQRTMIELFRFCPYCGVDQEATRETVVVTQSEGELPSDKAPIQHAPRFHFDHQAQNRWTQEVNRQSEGDVRWVFCGLVGLSLLFVVGTLAVFFLFPEKLDYDQGMPVLFAALTALTVFTVFLIVWAAAFANKAVWGVLTTLMGLFLTSLMFVGLIWGFLHHQTVTSPHPECSGSGVPCCCVPT